MSSSDERIIVLECVCIKHIVFCPCPGITCRPQDTAPAAEQHTQHKNGVTRMLTLPVQHVQHVPALNPHSKIPSDRGRVARSTWFDFQGLCVRVPVGTFIQMREERVEKYIRRLRTKASPSMCLASHTAWFEKLPRQYVQFLSHNQVNWEEATKTNPGSSSRM